MTSTKGLHTVGTGIVNVVTGLVNILAGSVDFAVSLAITPAPETPETPQPSTPMLSTLTDINLETLNQTHPFYLDVLQKYAQAFDKTHAFFIHQTFLSSDDLEILKKDYLNYITHQIMGIDGAQHNHADYYAAQLKKRLTQSPAHLIKTKLSVEQTLQITDVDSSVAYLWKTCDKQKGSPDINSTLNKIADAHGLIQATGWSTQNENSLFALIDAWNYYRYANNIAETYFIVRSLIEPFFPLFIEYQDIAHREKNTLLKIIRAAIPMLITAGFVICMTALIPVSLPELAFAILAMPLVYLGVALASLYIKTKEFMYQGYRYMRYQHDLTLFPEFQVNDKLAEAFQGQAESIRKYYIEAIQTCDHLENNYQQQTTFTSREIKLRNENFEQRNTLILEWFDLRDNTKLGTDQTPYIALKRLNSDKNRLNQTFKQQNLDEIQTFVEAMSQHLEHALYDAQADIADIADILVEEPEYFDAEEAPVLASISSLRFFPDYTASRTKIIELQQLEEQILANL
ncbi:MAG: hypothetical protein GW760_03975 [Legionella sp.]|jgi:hypothetical protein|nr:hypothetical protein [Legionella sp.]